MIKDLLIFAQNFHDRMISADSAADHHNFPPSPRRRRASLLLLLLLPLLLPSCGSSGTPLDADTRQAIDSISTAQISSLRSELDTLCRQSRSTELPRLVDSIKRHRLLEIQEQLKTVPK
jgi:hypothetical protein